MRILGIDYGHKRIGLALSDETEMLAQSFDTISGEETARACRQIAEIVKKNGVGGIVVGIPLNMNGTRGPQAERVLQFIAELQKTVSVPIHQWDERLTTAAAERAMLEGDVRRRERREKIDKIAAQLILQNYLDAENLRKTIESGDDV
jgi:putative Holliday junction resolvase